ncbi:glycosyltransferase family 8 protein [Variovorax sp. ZT4R33]|uniref:glycosyltransferase family 8 protein n=1 Tax=Variovorax sp. ZT4R33 TaxID=3443743 RepID=UPI003F44F53D
MDVVFNISPLGMEGLGVTLVSLVRNCSQPEKLHLHFLSSGLGPRDKDNVRRLLAGESFGGEISFIDFDAQKEFGELRPLHGDWTAYGRLLIPERIQAPRALYLDSDLAVRLDVLALEKEVAFNGEFMAAVFGCTVEWTIDQRFLKEHAGLQPDTPYFNSGVVFFDLDECRRRNAAQTWRNFARQHRDSLTSHDQTVLNAYANGRFVQLPARYNTEWPPAYQQPGEIENAIIHFSGSPKPWDLTGPWLHRGHSLWHSYRSAFWHQQYGRFNRPKWGRTWMIRHSIARVLKDRLLPKSRA